VTFLSINQTELLSASIKVRDIIGPSQWEGGGKSQKKPLVSVLLPTFRRGADGLFRRAAHSVLNQTLKDIELLIVDDASTDGTAEIIRELRRSDDRVSSMRHEHNIGLPAISEYEAYCRARGEYIAFAFDDFIFENDALELMLEHMRFAGARVAHGQTYIRDSAGRYQSLGHHCDAAHDRLIFSNFIGNGSFVLHRSVIEEIGLYDPHVGVARVCDWDLWRRVHQHYPLLAAPVAMGVELGLSRPDSLGNTYPMQFEAMQEMMAMDRNAILRPANFLDREVIAVPPNASYSLQLHIGEAAAFFKKKRWAQLQPASATTDAPKAKTRKASLPRSSGRFGDGLIVSVLGDMNASTFLYWRSSGTKLDYLNFIEPTGFCSYENSQLLRSDAVIFVREIFSARQASALAVCRALSIPHFYFIDDNFPCLADEQPGFIDYTESRLRKELRTFSGVIVPSPELARFYATSKLHQNIDVVPPVVNAGLLDKCRRNRLGPPPVSDDRLRLAFFGGAFRRRSLIDDVFPALNSLRGRALLLARDGSGENLHAGDPQFEIISLAETTFFSSFLETWSEYQPQIVLHPAGRTENIDYKSPNALLVSLYLGAVPIVCEEKAYEEVGEPEGVLKVVGDSRSWTDAIERLSDPAFRTEMYERLDAYCQKRFDPAITIRWLERATQHIAALDEIRMVDRLRRAFTFAQDKYIELARARG